jgi:hypothetical protein
MKRRKAHRTTKKVPPLTHNVRPQVLCAQVHCNIRNNTRKVNPQQTPKVRAMKRLKQAQLSLGETKYRHLVAEKRQNKSVVETHLHHQGKIISPPPQGPTRL